jgi:hypothetical protein
MFFMILLVTLTVVLSLWLLIKLNEGRSPQHRFRPEFDHLEHRLALSTFVWKAAMENGNWNDPANWERTDGNQGDRPVNADDIAMFDQDISNKSVVLDHADVTIKRLIVENNYNAEIKLSKSLTLVNDKTIGSSINANVKIAPQNTMAHLTLDNVKMNVFNGWLGNTTHKSDLLVLNGSELDFLLENPVKLGMNLIVGGAAGGQSSGTVTVNNSGANNLTVYNDANIAVNKASKLRLIGNLGGGWILDDGPTSGFVSVNGTVERKFPGAGEVKVQLPFLVGIGGTVDIRGCSLNINSNGNAATNQASLFVQAGGTVLLDKDDQQVVTTLIVSDEAIFDSGKLQVVSGTSAAIYANNLVEFKGASQLLMSLTGATTDVDLAFHFLGTNGKLKLTGGVWNFNVRAGGGSDRLTVFAGSVEINNVGTSLNLSTTGNPAPPTSFLLFSAALGITGDFAAKIVPEPFNYQLLPTELGIGYYVTPQT